MRSGAWWPETPTSSEVPLRTHARYWRRCQFKNRPVPTAENRAVGDPAAGLPLSRRRVLWLFWPPSLSYRPSPVSAARTTAQGVRPVNAPPSFSPEVAGPPGWAPVDYGLLRLYLPPGWAAVSLCTPTASTSEASGEFVNVGGASYQASTNKFLLRPGADQPTSCVPPRSGGWAVVGPLAGGAPRGWRPSTVNGTRVWTPVQEAHGHEALAVPSLRMELTAAGTGRKVLATLGLSSLAVLLGAGGTLPVPASWKAVRFDGLQASVPADWPVEVVTREDAIPGVCNEPVFSSPVVYLGNGGSVPSCGLEFGTQLAHPVDGLWVFLRAFHAAGGAQQAPRFWGFQTGAPLQRYGD